MQPGIVNRLKKFSTRHLLSSENGYLIPMAVALLGVMGFIMLGVANWQTSTNRIKQVQKVKAVAESIRQNVLVQIYNNQAWAATAGSDLCLLSGIECPDPATLPPGTPIAAQPLVLKNPEGLVFMDPNNPLDGFNLLGQRCNPAVDGGFQESGNNACPFRYELTWVPTDCVAGTCTINIVGDLKYRPKSESLDVPLKLDNLKIDFVRGKEANSLQMACTSVGGVFDQVTLKCSAKSKQTIQCPDGKILKVLVQGQIPNCIQLFSPQPPCPQGKAASGIDSTGMLICTAKVP